MNMLDQLLRLHIRYLNCHIQVVLQDTWQRTQVVFQSFINSFYFFFFFESLQFRYAGICDYEIVLNGWAIWFIFKFLDSQFPQSTQWKIRIISIKCICILHQNIHDLLESVSSESFKINTFLNYYWNKCKIKFWDGLYVHFMSLLNEKKTIWIIPGNKMRWNGNFDTNLPEKKTTCK